MRAKTFAATLVLGSAIFTSPLAAGPNLRENISFFGFDGGTSFFVGIGDDRDDHSFVLVSASGDVNVFCLADFLDPADLVKTSGNAQHGTATIDHVLDELSCSGGDAVQSLFVECEFDDVSYLHSIGIHTRIVNGERFRFTGNVKSASAVCTAELNGQTYSLNGSVNRDVIKE